MHNDIPIHCRVQFFCRHLSSLEIPVIAVQSLRPTCMCCSALELVSSKDSKAQCLWPVVCRMPSYWK